MSGGKVRQRAGAFQIDFSVRNTRFREQVNVSTLREARLKLAERITEESRRQGVRTRISVTAMSCEEALRLWKTEESPPKTDATRAGRFVEWAGLHRSLAGVETQDVTTWAHHRAEFVAATTARRELAAVSRMFAWAVKRGAIGQNPVRNAPKPSGVYDPPKPLSNADAIAVIKSVKGHAILEPAFMLALFAGLRRAEIARAKWEDVDLDSRTILVPKGKTIGARAHLPLIEPLLSWMMENKKKTGPIVVGRGKKPILPHALHLSIMRWNDARGDDDPELPNLHRCRHTAATLLIRAGVSIHVVARFMRHSSTRMIEAVYGHYGAVEFRDTISEGFNAVR